MGSSVRGGDDCSSIEPDADRLLPPATRNYENRIGGDPTARGNRRMPIAMCESRVGRTAQRERSGSIREQVAGGTFDRHRGAMVPHAWTVKPWLGMLDSAIVAPHQRKRRQELRSPNFDTPDDALLDQLVGAARAATRADRD